MSTVALPTGDQRIFIATPGPKSCMAASNTAGAGRSAENCFFSFELIEQTMPESARRVHTSTKQQTELLTRQQFDSSVHGYALQQRL